MTQRIRIESVSGHYELAIQCGPTEPFVLQPGETIEVNVWPGNELRVYEIGLARMVDPELLS